MNIPERNETTGPLDSSALKVELKRRQQELVAAIADAHESQPIGHLILMVGLPYSGKSTKAREMGHPIVSPDAIRLALHGERFRRESEPMVWAMAQTMVTALFLAGHETVIVDACHVSEKRRNKWFDDRWTITHVLVRTTKTECIRRAVSAYDTNIMPSIHRMADAFEWDGWSPTGDASADKSDA
jgi:adenylylsulfate kinase-like enzyme